MQSRSENLKFSRDAETGEISITGKAKTAEEKYMQRIINDEKITVNVTATNNDEVTSGGTFDIGAFMGNTVEKNANGEVIHVNAYQEYNVAKGGEADRKVKSPGNFVWHEIAEGYEGGKISAKTGIPAGKAFNDGNPHPVYDAAHNQAGVYFPGQYNTVNAINRIPDFSFPFIPGKTKEIKSVRYKLVR
jgi:hypothetical protein